jgi:hypothetical protein
MSLSEIPAKMIESAESFHGAHLETAVGLTAIVWQGVQAPSNEEEIFRTFIYYYTRLKEVAPPPLDKLTGQKKFKAIAETSAIISISALVLYYIFFIYLGINLKEVVLKLIQ